jgi:hypothetical protein
VQSNSSLLQLLEQSFHSPAASGLLFGITPGILPSAATRPAPLFAPLLRRSAQKVTKRLGTGRGVLIRILRIKIPCASRPRRVAQTVHPCTASQARRIHRRAPAARAAMLGTANGALNPRIRASLQYIDTNHNSSEVRLFASAAGCRPTGPPEARRGCVGKVRRKAHMMCASSLNVHGRTSGEPRSTLAYLEGRRRHGCRR